MRNRMLLFVLVVLLIGTTAYAQGSSPTTPPDRSQYRLVEIANGFTRPLFLTHAGDGSGRLFIVEQGGFIWILQNGETLPPPFLDISGLVSRDANERGLLGLAFHPNYAENGLFFINYTDRAGNTVVARYSVLADNPDLADDASAQIMLQIEQPFPNHNGGDIAFGPDGYLYIGMGDGGSGGDPRGYAQNPASLLGKMLRIDVDSGTPYAIPPDNPLVGDSTFAPEIWAWGLRNPWRFSFDRLTGDLYIADVGQNAWEEVNFQPADSAGGENYGWNIMEGTHRFSGAVPSADLVLPFAEYARNEGCSVTGGYVYRGELLPDLQGYYLFSDYCFGTVWASYRDADGNWQRAVFLDTPYTVSSFGQDEQGELYVIDHGGAITRLEAVP